VLFSDGVSAAEPWVVVAIPLAPTPERLWRGAARLRFVSSAPENSRPLIIAQLTRH